MKQILIIIHQDTSTPGLVGQVLQEAGYGLDIRRPFLGQELPSTMEHHDAAIIFGGPMSANDDETLPFIQTELNWIPIALESSKPFLGICLGAQMLARVLGARVAPHPDKLREIGYFPIMSTLAGQSCFSHPMYVYHWHKEGFELPSDAVLLATGQRFFNQAFRYGKSAYGVQFHPEITNKIMERWTTEAAEQLTLPGAQPRDEQIRQHALHEDGVHHWLQGFLNQWLGKVILHYAMGYTAS
jgi:GMP synthase (glutamine-hydrolysing)